MKTKGFFNKITKPKNKSYLDFDMVNKKLNEAKFHIKCENGDKKSISLILEDVRLITLNEILATLQLRDYELFKYKKNCHKKITEILDYYRLTEGELPKFNKKIKITLYRQSSRFIDFDSFIPSFKYFIDAFVKYPKVKILEDDDPNFITNIIPYQKKSKQTIVGIRLEEIDEQQTQIENLFIDWGFEEKEIKINKDEDIFHD